jgi:hypothetical protein
MFGHERGIEVAALHSFGQQRVKFVELNEPIKVQEGVPGSFMVRDRCFLCLEGKILAPLEEVQRRREAGLIEGPSKQSHGMHNAPEDLGVERGQHRLNLSNGALDFLDDADVGDAWQNRMFGEQRVRWNGGIKRDVSALLRSG